MQWRANTLVVDHNDLSHLARIALMAMGKKLNDALIYDFAKGTTCYWSDKTQLEEYVVEDPSHEKDKLLRSFLNANRMGSIASDGTLMRTQELVGRCPFCAHKIDDLGVTECPACKRSIY